MRLMAFAAAFWQRSFGPLTCADRRTVRLVRAFGEHQGGIGGRDGAQTIGAVLHQRGRGRGRFEHSPARRQTSCTAW